MKIHCPCGAIISDSTDSLPRKGYIIPDQEWFPVYDALDKVIDDIVSGHTKAETAYMHIRCILGDASRWIFQCRDCGRLFVDDRKRKMHIFSPSSDETSKEILRSRADVA
jgi:hypothetical protein